MAKEFNLMMQKPMEAEPIMALVDSFCDVYKVVYHEDEADEVFTMGRIREYFNAWPVPKMPDPLGAYIKELAERGYAVQTTYDGQPAIFVVRWQSNGEVCGVVEEIEAKREKVRTGAQRVGALLAARKKVQALQEKASMAEEDDDEEDDEDEDEKSLDPSMRYGSDEEINLDELPY